MEPAKNALDLIKEAVAYLDMTHQCFRLKDIRKYIRGKYPEMENLNKVNALLRKITKNMRMDMELDFILSIHGDLYEMNREKYEAVITLEKLPIFKQSSRSSILKSHHKAERTIF